MLKLNNRKRTWIWLITNLCRWWSFSLYEMPIYIGWLKEKTNQWLIIVIWWQCSWFTVIFICTICIRETKNMLANDLNVLLKRLWVMSTQNGLTKNMLANEPNVLLKRQWVLNCTMQRHSISICTSGKWWVWKLVFNGLNLLWKLVFKVLNLLLKSF